MGKLSNLPAPYFLCGLSYLADISLLCGCNLAVPIVNTITTKFSKDTVLTNWWSYSWFARLPPRWNQHQGAMYVYMLFPPNSFHISFLSDTLHMNLAIWVSGHYLSFLNCACMTVVFFLWLQSPMAYMCAVTSENNVIVLFVGMTVAQFWGIWISNGYKDNLYWSILLFMYHLATYSITGILAFKSTSVTCWYVNIPIPEKDILLER
jgi:hypothetical protein